MNKLKQNLSKGELVLGTWCELPSPELVNVLAKAGLDFVIIDMEHGTMDFSSAAKMIMAANAENCAALIRVSKNDESDILKALEIAPQGILVPHIESVSDRKRAVEYAKFPPIGKRSLNPYTRAGGYHSYPDYTREQNTNVLLSLLIEGENGVKDLDQIIDNNIDILYIGTYDISLALGIPGEVKNQKVISQVEKMVKTIRQKGKIAGGMFHDKKELHNFRKSGMQFLCYKVDTAVVFDEFQKIKSLAEMTL